MPRPARDESDVARGRRVSAARERLRLSQEELAARADVSRSTIQALERGDDVGPRSIRRVAAALGVEPRQLLPPGKTDDDTSTAAPNMEAVPTAALVEELYRRFVADPQAVGGALRIAASDGRAWEHLSPHEQAKVRKAIGDAGDATDE